MVHAKTDVSEIKKENDVAIVCKASWKTFINIDSVKTKKLQIPLLSM